MVSRANMPLVSTDDSTSTTIGRSLFILSILLDSNRLFYSLTFHPPMFNNTPWPDSPALFSQAFPTTSPAGATGATTSSSQRRENRITCPLFSGNRREDVFFTEERE